MGLFSTLLAPIAGSVIGGLFQSNSTNRAVDASTAASQAAINEQRRQFDIAMGLTAPTRNFQNQAQNQLAGLLGFSGGGGTGGQIYSNYPPFSGQYGGYSGQFGGGGSRSFRGLERDPPWYAGSQFNGQGVAAKTAAPTAAPDPLAALRDTPGYQFAVDEAIRNSNAGAAGRGQFFSGAAGDALQGRLHGLADQTYGNAVNRLLAAAGGGTSAAQTASQGLQSGQIVGGLLQDQGNARASGILGNANTLNGIINGAITAYSTYKNSDPGGIVPGGAGIPFKSNLSGLFGN